VNKERNDALYYAYIPALDTLRFVVFIFILANHTRINTALNGHSFFFTLTGFLISYISISEIRKKGHFNFSRYLARRFLRTLPLFFTIVSLCFFINYISESFFDKTITTGKLWPYLLLIHNFFDLNILFPLANLWAMSVTEQYYIIFGLLFFFIFPVWKWFGVLFVAAGLMINMASYFIFDHYNYAYSWYFLVNFGVGNILALFCVERNNLFQKLSGMNRLLTLLYFSAGIILLIIGFSISDNAFSPFKEFVLSMGYSLIIFNVSFGKYSPSFITSIGWIQYLGKRTLGMYCWHAPIITILTKTAEYYDVILNPLTTFIMTLILVIPVSIISYKYYESYFLRFKKYFNS
jgi:peptidoglycan/LPS O-acetylase OafA/YrhL